MARKTETIEHRICDLCGQEMYPDQVVTLHRSDNKFSAAKKAALGTLGSQPGQPNVDVCPNCRQRPVSDVVDLMYPAQG
jgi:hypothetical protein